mmetsp:Transcript_23869/g.65021  ORF Transcript_23869/g.65021 Transcript_23869/m.65021 type:complete len:277 (+) Transcript_23869:41-871(+)
MPLQLSRGCASAALDLPVALDLLAARGRRRLAPSGGAAAEHAGAVRGHLPHARVVATARLAPTTVLVDEEGHEKAEVAEVHDNAEAASGLAQVAVPAVEPPPSCRHGDKGADNHLHDLRNGDEDRPRRHELAEGGDGHAGVVEVHERVHRVVHRAIPEARSGVADVGLPAEEQNRDVVVPVQEDDALALEHQEDGVQQLRELREDEHLQPEADLPLCVPVARRRAHGVEEAVPHHVLEQVGHHRVEADPGERGEADVPDDERPLEHLARGGAERVL